MFVTCYLQLTRLFVSQYSVSLQSEEEIQQQYQRRPGQAISVTGHGRHMESCLHTASSHFSLPIPLNVTPGFSTDIGQSPVGFNVSDSLLELHVSQLSTTMFLQLIFLQNFWQTENSFNVGIATNIMLEDPSSELQ